MRSNATNFIQRLKRQKEDALDYVVATYLPLIKGVVFKVLSPLEDNGLIEECMNDTLLSIWNNSNKFHGDSTDFKKWVCAIAKFKAIDYYRKKRVTPVVAKTEFDIRQEPSAEDEWIRSEDQAELIHLINLLEPVDRNIFIMKFFLGKKAEDISVMLGLTRASVDNRIYRGKKKLMDQASSLNGKGDVH